MTRLGNRTMPRPDPDATPCMASPCCVSKAPAGRGLFRADYCGSVVAERFVMTTGVAGS